MLKNYFKTAWRNIRKNKLFSIINILGLSLGIATCFILMLYVKDETSYDRFNKRADDIVRVIFRGDINGGKINESIVMPPVAQTMKNDFPEVEDATRLKNYGPAKIIFNDKVFKNDQLAFVDPNFLSIFTLPTVEGNAETALVEPHTVVLTKATAQKYFGNEKAVGKIIAFDNKFENTPETYKITGVIENIPANSHFHFDMLASMKGWKIANPDTWLGSSYYTYLLLRPGTDLKKLEAKFPAMVAKYMGPQIEQQMGLSYQQFTTKGNSLGFALQPLTSIHLYSSTNNELEPGGNANYVYIFAGVALFLLIIACINFINLSTAGASKRSKEVGIRKAIGSARLQLVTQFLSESILITFFALILAIAIIQLVLPEFNSISGKHLSFDVKPIIGLIVLGLFVGLVSGIYPAVYLSSFQPIAVLKGNLARNNKAFGFRSVLVVFQFFISVGLIIGTIVVYQQMKFIQHKDLGYNKDQLITIPNSYLLGDNERMLKNECLQDPRIVNATVSWYRPAGPSNYNNSLAYPQGNDHLIVNGVEYHVDEAYIPTLGMQMVSGRNFSKDFKEDSSAIILNETAANSLGWNNATAVGKTVIRQNSERGDNFPFQ